MAITLRSAADLQARHQAIFARMDAQVAEEMKEAAFDLLDESQQIHMGSGAQPQGDSRRKWLAEENHPYRWPGFAEANPIGVISGDLLASIRLNYFATGSYFFAQTYSQGVDYAKFVWSWDGTEKMVPRMVRQHMQVWAQNRMRQVGRNLVMFQRSQF